MEDKKHIVEEVIKAIDSIRPYLQADGGDLAFVGLTDDMRVQVRLKGACTHCPMNMQTLKGGVEMVVKNQVPQILEVVAV